MFRPLIIFSACFMDSAGFRGQLLIIFSAGFSDAALGGSIFHTFGTFFAIIFYASLWTTTLNPA